MNVRTARPTPTPNAWKKININRNDDYQGYKAYLGRNTKQRQNDL